MKRNLFLEVSVGVLSIPIFCNWIEHSNSVYSPIIRLTSAFLPGVHQQCLVMNHRPFNTSNLVPYP